MQFETIIVLSSHIFAKWVGSEMYVVGYLQIKGLIKSCVFIIYMGNSNMKTLIQNMNRFKSTLWASICSHSLGIEYVSTNI